MRRWLMVSVLMLGTAAPVAADSLWATGGEGAQNLYSNSARALGLGDIVTIRIVENMRATNSAELETEKESNKELSLQDIVKLDIPFGIGNDITRIFGVPLDTSPSFGLDATSDFSGKADSERTARITGTVSAQIVDILSNGTLKIEATQALHINEEMNTIVLTGLIRPDDVSADNTILSTRIANAEIFYTGRGPLTNTNKRGLLTELWEFVWPF